MKKRSQYIISGCLVVGGLILISYHFLHTSPPKKKIPGMRVSQQIPLDSLLHLPVSKPARERKADIIALFVLKSNVCPACINNTIDYRNLMRAAKTKHIALSALFVDADSQAVDRFMKITELAIPYRVANEKQLPVWLQQTAQELIFIHRKNQDIFYRVGIPGNITTTLRDKKEVLAKAVSIFNQRKHAP